MPKTPHQFHHSQHSDENIYQSIMGILEANVLISMATVHEQDGVAKAWVHTAYFAYSLHLEFYFLTPPTAQHSKNLLANTSAALSIFDSRQDGQQKQGLQVFGNAERAKGDDLKNGFETYSKRFVWMAGYIPSIESFDDPKIESRLYVIKPHTIKIFDEKTFGKGEWVQVSVQNVKGGDDNG